MFGTHIILYVNYNGTILTNGIKNKKEKGLLQKEAAWIPADELAVVHGGRPSREAERSMWKRQ